MLLEFKDVVKDYGRLPGQAPVVVLNHVSFQLAAGESMAIVGPSGTGKSTLLNIIGALDQPTTGQVCLTRAYSIGRPLVNACLQYLGIVFSFVYGMLLFKDPLTWHAFFGMLLIIGAGIAATLLRSKVAPPPKDSQFNPADS